MKDYGEDNRHHEIIVLGNKIVGAIFLPIVFLVLLICRINPCYNADDFVEGRGNRKRIRKRDQ